MEQGKRGRGRPKTRGQYTQSHGNTLIAARPGPSQHDSTFDFHQDPSPSQSSQIFTPNAVTSLLSAPATTANAQQVRSMPSLPTPPGTEPLPTRVSLQGAPLNFPANIEILTGSNGWTATLPMVAMVSGRYPGCFIGENLVHALGLQPYWLQTPVSLATPRGPMVSWRRVIFWFTLPGWGYGNYMDAVVLQGDGIDGRIVIGGSFVDEIINHWVSNGGSVQDLPGWGDLEETTTLDLL